MIMFFGNQRRMKKPALKVLPKRNMKNQERQSSQAHKKGPWALKTASVDFSALREMFDELYIGWIYSNNVYTILSTRGREAAREALIREVKHLFTGDSV
ncbi:DNA-directed RNA polymerase [Bertholletia excelsa]